MSDLQSATQSSSAAELALLAKERGSWRAGLAAPFRGLSFLVRRPDIWWLAIIPSAWALVITVTLSTVAVRLLPSMVTGWMGNATAWYAQLGAAVAAVAVTVVGVLLSVVAGLVLAQPLSGPALERLSRHMEMALGVHDCPVVPFWRQVGRSAAAVLIGLGVGLPVLAVLSIVTFLVPPSVWITFPLKMVVLGLMVTWDLMDYPFSTRGWSLRLRARWMRQHVGAVLGFGLSLGLVFLIPCVQVLLLPVGAVGATWLFQQRERSGVPLLQSKN